MVSAGRHVLGQALASLGRLHNVTGLSDHLPPMHKRCLQEPVLITALKKTTRGPTHLAPWSSERAKYHPAKIVYAKPLCKKSQE